MLGIARRVGDRDWKDIWLDSPEHQRVLADIATIKAEGLARPLDTKTKQSTCECRRFTQCLSSFHVNPRRNFYFLPTAKCCAKEQRSALEIPRLRVHSSLRTRLHLAFHLVGFPQAWK